MLGQIKPDNINSDEETTERKKLIDAMDEMADFLIQGTNTQVFSNRTTFPDV